MFSRVGTLLIKELIQFRRDWVLLVFILLAPALQLVLMAQAIARGVVEQPTAVLDLDRSPLSRQFIVDLDNSETLRVKRYLTSTDEMRELLDRGVIRLAVIIPAGFAAGLSRGDFPQEVQVIADGSNSVSASISIGSVADVVNRFSADLIASYGLVVPEFVDFRTDIRFNPTLDFRDFSLPAQLGFVVYQVTLAVASLGLARERELGTLEQLMVTPLRQSELTLGKGLPALVIGGVNFAIMWVIGLVVFHVPMNGSLGLLAALTLLFITTVVGWGLLISAVSRTQQQAILFVFILAMVEITLSGFIVPVENMPPVLRTVSNLAPLRHYLVIIRGVMLKGAGLRELWPHVLALAGLSLLMGSIAARMVSRRLE